MSSSDRNMTVWVCVHLLMNLSACILVIGDKTEILCVYTCIERIRGRRRGEDDSDGKTKSNFCWFLCAHFMVLHLNDYIAEWVLNPAVLNVCVCVVVPECVCMCACVCGSPLLAGLRYWSGGQVKPNLCLMQEVSRSLVVDTNCMYVGDFYSSEADSVFHQGVLWSGCVLLLFNFIPLHFIDCLSL